MERVYRVNLCFIIVILYAFAAWKWGDWRNWRVYYPTILFMIVGDLLYQFLFHDYSMWEFNPVGLDHKLNLKHTHFSLMTMIVVYPSTILLFLGNLPKTRMRRVAWIGLWVVIYTIAEWLKLLQGSMIHEHGWNMCWSILFNIVMFSILMIHFRRPLFAWLCTFIFIIFLIEAHEVPPTIFK